MRFKEHKALPPCRRTENDLSCVGARPLTGRPAHRQSMLPDFLPCTHRAPTHEGDVFALLSIHGTSGQALPRRPCTALRRGAPGTDCAAQHARAKRTCEPGLLGASNDNRSLEIATGVSAHGHAARKTHRWMTQTLHWGLTFDMRGGLQTAKPAVRRPLDGRVIDLSVNHDNR